MIDLNLDPSETRPDRMSPAKPGPSLNLKVVLFGVAGASALVGFGVAASTVMAGLAAPTPVKIVASRQAADWPELKDGLPAIKGSVQAAAAPAQPAKPETPALRMVSLPEAFAAITPAPEGTRARPAAREGRRGPRRADAAHPGPDSRHACHGRAGSRAAGAGPHGRASDAPGLRDGPRPRARRAGRTEAGACGGEHRTFGQGRAGGEGGAR